MLGIQKPSQIETHPLRGQLFETYIVSEILKKRFNSVKDNNLYDVRENIGNEIDLILDYGNNVLPIELKSGATFPEDMLKVLNYYNKLAQTFSDWEMIIVDDGSTDNNVAVIGSYQDPRIIYIRQEHVGPFRLAETHNRALADATGP